MILKQLRCPGRGFAALLLLIAASALLAACGSSNKGNSASTGSSTSSSAASSSSSGGSTASKLQALVAEHEKEPTNIVQAGETVKKAPPKGMSIVSLDCGQPVCAEISQGIQEAAASLGWKYTRIIMGGVPSTIISAWNQAVALKPNVVIAAGVPVTLFKEQRKKLEAEGGIYVAKGAGEPAGNGVIHAEGLLGVEERSEWEAQWITVNSGGHAHVQFFQLPEFPITVQNGEALKKELAKYCSGCTIKINSVTAEQLGKQTPSDVVSTLQREPESNYVVMAYEEMSLGVPLALKAAHLKAAIVSSTYNESVKSELEHGEFTMTIAEPQIVSGWGAVDAAVRAVNHESQSPNAERRASQIITAKNAPALPYQVPKNYKEQYEKLWKLG